MWGRSRAMFWRAGNYSDPREWCRLVFFSSIDRCSERWSSKVYLSSEMDSKSHDLSTLEGLGSIPRGQISGLDLGKIFPNIRTAPCLYSLFNSTHVRNYNSCTGFPGAPVELVTHFLFLYLCIFMMKYTMYPWSLQTNLFMGASAPNPDPDPLTFDLY